MLGTLVPLSAFADASPLEYVGGAVLAAAADSVTIPVNPVYTMLFIEFYGINDGNAKSLYLRFNGDSTSTTYSYQSINATSTTIAGARTTGANQIVLSADTLDASVWQEFTAICVKSTAGTAGQVLVQSAYDPAATIKLELDGAQWGNTSAPFTSVSVVASSNNLAAGTTIAVYGLRG